MSNYVEKSFSRALIGSALLIVVALTVVLASQKGCDCSGNDAGRADNSIDTSGFVSPGTKNNIDLANWAAQAYEKNWGYVYGTFGTVLSERTLTEKINQYPVDVGENEVFIRRNWLERRCTDCVGLIKGYCWFNAEQGWFDYCENGMPDCGANRMFDDAPAKGELETLPETVGLAVWCDGHIGVYIGDGWVIEAKSTLEGVLKTRVNERKWTHWLEIPNIEYIEE